MLQYEIDTPLQLMAKRIGQDRATRIWRRSRQAVDALRERTERLGIDADTATCGSIYLDRNILDAEGLRRETEARRRAGFEVELLGPAAMEERYGIRRQTRNKWRPAISIRQSNGGPGYIRPSISSTLNPRDRE